MLNFFKKKPGSRKSISAQSEQSALNGDDVCRLMSAFSIGTKFKYYPEFRKEILLESLVIGYSINNELVYSVKDLSCLNGVVAFTEAGRKKSYKKIRRFRLVVPIFKQSEGKLDYARREELQKIGGMVRGNNVTLMAEMKNGQSPSLECIVDKRTVLQHGFYAKHAVAMLDVDLESLKTTDQREYVRLRTDIPASIKVAEGSRYAMAECKMVDFSDRALRVSIDADLSEEAHPKKGDSCIVSFNLPGQPGQTSLTGKAFRVEGNSAVIMLEGQVKNNRMTELAQVDVLNIKANLLQSGANLHSDWM